MIRGETGSPQGGGQARPNSQVTYPLYRRTPFFPSMYVIVESQDPALAHDISHTVHILSTKGVLENCTIRPFHHVVRDGINSCTCRGEAGIKGADAGAWLQLPYVNEATSG